MSSSLSYVFDTRYIPHVKQPASHLLGWIKVCETVCSLVAFLCLIVSITFIFFKLVMIFGFIITTLYWLLAFVHVPSKICAARGINESKAAMAEVLGYGCVAIAYITANLIISIRAHQADEIAACVFGWLALVSFLVDGVFSLLEWRKRHNDAANQNPVQSTMQMENNLGGGGTDRSTANIGLRANLAVTVVK